MHGVINVDAGAFGGCQAPASSDVSEFLSDYYWRFDLEHTRAEHVRRRDEFVATRRRMTSDEIKSEMKKSLAGGDGMNKRLNAEKYKELEGKVLGPGTLTFLRLTGQHPSTGAALGDFECACGKVLTGLLVSDVKSGRRKYCNARTCTALPGPIEGQSRKLTRGERSKERRRGRLISEESRVLKRGVSGPRGKRAQRDLPPRPSVTQALAEIARDEENDSRAALISAAATMRQAAVLANLGSVGTAVGLLRRQAEMLDERIYAPEG